MFSTSLNNNLISLAHVCENHNQCILKKGMNGLQSTPEMKKEKKVNNNHRNGVKKIKPTEIRREEVLAIRNRFPTKIPIIVHRFSREHQLPQLEKSKFLVPQEITMSQFQTIIRNRMQMHPNQALYLLVNERSMLSLSLTLAEVYSEYAGPDGFLYITYASQEVFGSTCSNKMEELPYSDNTKKVRMEKVQNPYEKWDDTQQRII